MTAPISSQRPFLRNEATRGTKSKGDADLRGEIIGFYDGVKWFGGSTVTQGSKVTIGTFEFAKAKAKDRLSGAI